MAADGGQVAAAIRMARFARAAAAGAALFAAQAALAQEHQGDILPNLTTPRSASARIVLEGAGPAEPATGYRVYTGDFGDFAGGPLKTEDPGYDTQDGAFIPGTLLGLRALGVLEFWDGTSWMAAPAGASLTITDALNGVTTLTGSGITRPEGLVGQFDTQGNLHEHLDMAIGAAAPVGVYAVRLQLYGQTAPGAPAGNVYLDSEPFVLLLNRGASPAVVNAATAARISPAPVATVPLPATALAGLAFLLAAIGVRLARPGANRG